ncbi:uncharacterized protein METZ01_LOCUS383591, partial [marine metagenome]
MKYIARLPFHVEVTLPSGTRPAGRNSTHSLSSVTFRTKLPTMSKANTDTNPILPLATDLPSGALSLLFPEETIRLSITTDIKLDGLYGPAWLLATDQRLLAFSPDGGGPPEIVDLALTEVESLEIQDLYGSGALKVRTQTTGQTVALFSKTLNAKFAPLPEALEKLIRQARPIDDDKKILRGRLDHAYLKRRCERCGQVIPHRMGVCPSCLESNKLLNRFLTYSLPYWPLAVTSLAILLAGTFIGLTPPL